MCGIAGIFNLKGGGIDKNTLANMTDLMEHRGPDDRGFWSDDFIGLGHRRLAIIDLETGHQPMSDPQGRFHIVFNGEIYNYPQLRRILEARGHRFRTKSDTEVLLHCFLEFGERCPEKLNGMFAFAVWDKQEKRLFLCRDRLGIKPLYYAQMGDNFLFASEIKSILAFPGFPRQINLRTVGFYLSHYQSVMGDETLFNSVCSLLPGCSLTIDHQNCRRRKYWMLPIVPESEKEDKGENYFIARIRELMWNSVERRLISDVPVGAYLSGGLDSSILVALMSDLAGAPVKTYAIGFPDEGFNEFYYADQVAAANGTDHTRITIEADDYFNTLAELIRFKDAPLSVPNEIPLYLMSKVLKNSITVVLSGEGSDELFAGYGAILRSPFDYLRSLPGSDVPQAQRKLLNKALLRLYGRTEFQGELDHFLQVYSWMKPADFALLFNQDVLQETRNFAAVENFWRRKFNEIKNLDIYNKYLYLMETVHLPGLLGRLDTTTMAASVEGRVPFTDPDLLEAVNLIPWNYKLRWNSPFYENICVRLNAVEIAETMDTTKYILKRSFVDKVPPDILFRKKFSFPVPLNNWMANGILPGILGSALERCPDFLDREGILKWLALEEEGDRSLKIWMLLNLIVWHNLYFEKSSEPLVLEKEIFAL